MFVKVSNLLKHCIIINQDVHSAKSSFKNILSLPNKQTPRRHINKHCNIKQNMSTYKQTLDHLLITYNRELINVYSTKHASVNYPIQKEPRVAEK